LEGREEGRGRQADKFCVIVRLADAVGGAAKTAAKVERRRRTKRVPHRRTLAKRGAQSTVAGTTPLWQGNAQSGG
jgi:hypothetical protein